MYVRVHVNNYMFLLQTQTKSLSARAARSSSVSLATCAVQSASSILCSTDLHYKLSVFGVCSSGDLATLYQRLQISTALCCVAGKCRNTRPLNLKVLNPEAETYNEPKTPGSPHFFYALSPKLLTDLTLANSRTLQILLLRLASCASLGSLGWISWDRGRRSQHGIWGVAGRELWDLTQTLYDVVSVKL